MTEPIPHRDSSSGRLVSLDVLRGIAALAVIGIHIPHHAQGGWRENWWFFPAFLLDFGSLGVPLFVVISGFCIHRRAAIRKAATGRADVGWLDFWKRRFWRLYPPYVAAMAFSIVLALFVHDRFPEFKRTLGWDLLAHVFMFHNLTDQFATGLERVMHFERVG